MAEDTISGQADRKPSRDFPIAIATLPATAEQRRTAVSVIITLVFVAALIAPFANVGLGRVDTFVHVLQTVLSVAALITAVLLFAQYLILPQRALLAVASAYLCSTSFAFLQTLAFPGAYAPAGLIGDGFNSPAWFFVLWHATFPLGILIYAAIKDKREPIVQLGRSPEAAIGLTFFGVAIVVAGLAWLVTAGVGNLPVNARSALSALRSKPPELEELDDILRDIETDTLRVSEVISSVRGLFKNTTDHRTNTVMADCARQALNLAEPELLANQVSVSTQFLDNQAQVHADLVQLQQVILNLIRNAIEAMGSVAPDGRRLRVTTEISAEST